MHILYDNQWACEDCVMYLANGDIPEERPDLADDIAAQWPNDKDLVIGTDTDEFSCRPCDCCGSRLGGSRTSFVVRVP